MNKELNYPITGKTITQQTDDAFASIIPFVQEKLQEIQELEYVDEDWGQLDYYSPHPPVKFPCVLIDIQNANFSNIGKDRKKTPQNRQMAEVVVSLMIANLRLTNTSGKAPQSQKTNARSIQPLIEQVHQKVQGLSNEQMSSLIRIARNRIKNDDGVQMYEVKYKCRLSNV